MYFVNMKINLFTRALYKNKGRVDPENTIFSNYFIELRHTSMIQNNNYFCILYISIQTHITYVKNKSYRANSYACK